MIINFPYSGITKIPGSELGFVRLYSDNILNRDEIFGKQEIMQIECGTIFSDDEKKYILERIKKGEQIIFFGGDHASTSVIWSNIIQTDKEMAVIIFDAHNDYGDTVNGYYNTNVLDFAERYFKHGILFGIRQTENMKKKARMIEYIPDYYVLDKNYYENKILELSHKIKKVYVSIDLDVMNPIEFPGVGFPIAGGLRLIELLSLISYIKNNFDTIIWDIVEFNPLIENIDSQRAIIRLIKHLRL